MRVGMAYAHAARCRGAGRQVQRQEVPCSGLCAGWSCKGLQADAVKILAGPLLHMVAATAHSPSLCAKQK